MLNMEIVLSLTQAVMCARVIHYVASANSRNLQSWQSQAGKLPLPALLYGLGVPYTHMWTSRCHEVGTMPSCVPCQGAAITAALGGQLAAIVAWLVATHKIYGAGLPVTHGLWQLG